MSRNTKIRGIVWLTLAVLVIIAVGSASYTVQSQNLAGELIFEGKTEDQIGLEFLEIYSAEYEERPIISVTKDDYSFDVHRSILRASTNDTDLYIVFKDLEVIDVSGSRLPSIGALDAFVYCGTEEDPYQDMLSSQRLGAIPGTDVFAHFLSLSTADIDACGDNQFFLIVDIPQIIEPGQKVNEEDIEVIEFISLSELYDVAAVSTGVLLAETTPLNQGFSGDITKSSYNIFSLQRAVFNSALSVPLILPIAFGLWYSIEREIFNQDLNFRFKKEKNGKK
jgi:hypothetical protein